MIKRSTAKNIVGVKLLFFDSGINQKRHGM